MKIRSKALYAYLQESSVLAGTEEDIIRAKLEYRKMYKRQWKQQRKPRKEIRIDVTLKDFHAIRAAAVAAGMPHTTYVRLLVLSSLGVQQYIPHKDVLLKVLQLISMAAIASAKSFYSLQLIEQLTQAEYILLNYLKGISHE
jgi:predicted DNA binding CopG/RHH family protein